MRRLRSAGINGATTHRGFWGFHGDAARRSPLAARTPRTYRRDRDRDRIVVAFDVIDELFGERGPVPCETVPAVRAA